MNKVKKQGKRMLSLLLCTVLAMSGLTVPTKQVHAVETQAEENTGNTKTIAGLGTSVTVFCTIKNLMTMALPMKMAKKQTTGQSVM